MKWSPASHPPTRTNLINVCVLHRAQFDRTRSKVTQATPSLKIWVHESPSFLPQERARSAAHGFFGQLSTIQAVGKRETTRGNNWGSVTIGTHKMVVSVLVPLKTHPSSGRPQRITTPSTKLPTRQAHRCADPIRGSLVELWRSKGFSTSARLLRRVLNRYPPYLKGEGGFPDSTYLLFPTKGKMAP